MLPNQHHSGEKLIYDDSVLWHSTNARTCNIRLLPGLWKLLTLRDCNLNLSIVGYIKEPAGIDFVVDPKPLTEADRKKISAVIGHYKATGKKMPKPKSRFKKAMAKKKI